MLKAREKKTVMTKTFKTILRADVAIADGSKDDGQMIFNKRYAFYKKMSLEDIKNFLQEKELKLVRIHEFYRMQKGYRIPVEVFEERMKEYEVPDYYEKILLPYDGYVVK